MVIRTLEDPLWVLKTVPEPVRHEKSITSICSIDTVITCQGKNLVKIPRTHSLSQGIVLVSKLIPGIRKEEFLHLGR